jgi:aldehyde dehydrogenase (NAD+)
MSRVATEPPRLQQFVGGAWVASTGDGWLDDRNPSDATDLVAYVPEGSPEDARRAATAAAAAFERWSTITGVARADHLYRWSTAIADRQEELAQAVAREVGKPIGEARGEVARCVAILRYYAGEAVRQVGEVIPAQAAGALQFTLREPLGVVALITPWNFPVAIPLWKTAPALAFGNTVVLKPAEMSSHVASLLAETASVSLPAGVFNLVPGSGPAVGEALLRAPEVSAISFTGSGRVGARVAAIAAERNIRYQTEMGGKNVAIVLPDADLAQAASLTAAGAMRYAGPEVHRYEPGRRGARHRGPVPRRAAPPDRRPGPGARDGTECSRGPGDQRARPRFHSPNARRNQCGTCVRGAHPRFGGLREWMVPSADRRARRRD